ncbi:hypothetical protein KW790_00580 [Candidatus Parcubacteria bacterium]|nr:hypothetical protein [Candidatus Parcubacteria bacterium]
MEGNSMENIGRKSLILHFASLCAKELTEEDPVKQEKIEKEKKVISSGLGMDTAEIILEASNLITPSENSE